MALLSMIGEQDTATAQDALGLSTPPAEEIIPAISEDAGDDDNLKRTLDKIMLRFDHYRDDDRRQNAMRLCGAVYRAYNAIAPTNRGPYRQNYFRRVIFRMLETVKPLIIEQFMPGEDMFRYLPEHPGEEDSKAAATRIVHKQIRSSKSGRSIELELIKFLEGTVMWGTMYLATGWSQFKFTRRKIRVLHEDTEDMEDAWERETDEIESGCPYAEAMYPWECYTHPEIDDPRRSPCFFIQKICTVSDLWTMVREGWLNEDKCQAAFEKMPNGGSTFPIDESIDFSRPDRAMLYNVGLDNESDDSPHELLTCWTNTGWEYVILDRLYILRAQRLRDGKMPVHCLRNYPQAGEHWGLSEVVPVLEEQRLLNDFTSMYVDSCKYTTTPMMLGKRGAACTAWRSANFRPGAIIPVDDLESIRPLEMPNAPGNIREIMGDMEQSMNNATGITQELGGSGTSASTATGQVHLEQAANKRLGYKIKLWTPEWRGIMRDFYALNGAFLQEKVRIRYEGDDGAEAFSHKGPEVFGDDECEVELSNNPTSTMEEVNAALQGLQMLNGDPLTNQIKLREDYWRTRKHKNPRQMINNPALASVDALSENRDWYGFGSLPEPNQNDDHATHLQIHQMVFEQALKDPNAPLNAMAAMHRHIAIHQAYMVFTQNQAMAQQQAQLAGPAQTPGQPTQKPKGAANEANARTEGSFGNKVTGANRNGAMPGGG